MAPRQEAQHPRRIYPLDPRELTQEQLAVVFAMTSRRPEPFDEIAGLVTAEKAADFHERWVLGYGHASVAEHAVLHMAVENISRLACDALEDNRLASYTEMSSRYQVLVPGHYFVPPELETQPELRAVFVETCDRLFTAYALILEGCKVYLPTVRTRLEGERDAAYALRLRREATDACRFVLPAATLTNVGVTMNARILEHAVSKLLSSDLEEERQIGQAIKEEGHKVTPTLIKYAEESPHLVETRKAQKDLAAQWRVAVTGPSPDVELLQYDSDAVERVAAAVLYRYAGQPYSQVWERVREAGAGERATVLREALGRLRDFDALVRETELVAYTFEFTMDYGAYREFKRHRMQTYIPQPLVVGLGYVVPELVEQAGLRPLFQEAMEVAQLGYSQVAGLSPRVAEYLVTHAHRRRVLSRMSLRECYHLFKLRTSPQAHPTLRDVMRRALELCRGVHPALFEHIRLRT
ncbi:MAG: FAD-dependent thymidylate synthase [Chloroflexi bacterium]|nr:FAD-dependent thymidylate synthase [Chloroflexota bacterium]